MAGLRIKFNTAGFVALRQDPGVQADMSRRAEAVAKAAGGASKGYEARHPTRFPNRDRAAVITTTAQARADNARNMTLVKALQAGRS